MGWQSRVQRDGVVVAGGGSPEDNEHGFRRAKPEWHACPAARFFVERGRLDQAGFRVPEFGPPTLHAERAHRRGRARVTVCHEVELYVVERAMDETRLDCTAGDLCLEVRWYAHIGEDRLG